MQMLQAKLRGLSIVHHDLRECPTSFPLKIQKYPWLCFARFEPDPILFYKIKTYRLERWLSGERFIPAIDLSWIPSTGVRGLTTTCNYIQATDPLFCLYGHLYSYIHTSAQTHMHIYN